MTKYIIIFIIIFGGNLLPQDIKEKAEEMIVSAFPGKVTFSSEKYFIPSDIKSKVEKLAQQKFYSETVYVYTIYQSNKKLAYAFIDNVKGKAMPITFLTIIDPSGKIISTSILKYREQYGGAVQNESWNKQFKGKNKDSDIKVGKDINGITGATISTNSVTTGIKKIVLLFNEIKNNL